MYIRERIVLPQSAGGFVLQRERRVCEGQAFGLNAENLEVSLDVSRFDEDSQFTGDQIELVVGDPFSGDAVSWSAPADLGTVVIDGSTASADNLIFMNFDEQAELPGSFEVSC